ncbi:MAG: hypothetical protein GX130_11980 [Candidatus Hydrogenedens sp.]|jgi:hypothetical protein|nr:hypothetical protein [Candidatus Hydrogenedens sp.]
MDNNTILVQMLRQLLKEMEIVSSQGAGYYTCVPFARRFNKLLEQARNLHGAENAFLHTFESLEEHDPKDPSDKSNVLLGIRVEISQLITYLECLNEGKA